MTHNLHETVICQTGMGKSENLPDIDDFDALCPIEISKYHYKSDKCVLVKVNKNPIMNRSHVFV